MEKRGHWHKSNRQEINHAMCMISTSSLITLQTTPASSRHYCTPHETSPTHPAESSSPHSNPLSSSSHHLSPQQAPSQRNPSSPTQQPSSPPPPHSFFSLPSFPPPPPPPPHLCAVESFPAPSPD